MLYMVLLHQQFRHPGAPKQGPTASLSSRPTSILIGSPVMVLPVGHSLSTMLEGDMSNITLALRTLGSFNFGGVLLYHYTTSPLDH